MSDSPLRIAYLTYRGKPHVGGQGIYTRHLTKALVDLGHSVEVFGGQPYPVLDERVPLTELPSLDLFNDLYPGRFPAYWEIKTREDLLEIAPVLHRYVLRAAGVQLPGTAGTRPPRRRVRPRARQPVPRLRHPRARTPHPARSPPSTTRSPAIACSRWSGRRTGASGGRSGAGTPSCRCRAGSRRRLPRIVVVSENSIKDIHTDMGVSLDRMRLVPVGVDPELFRPLPEVTRVPGRLITTASADVALKGLAYLLEAMAKLRTERDISLTIIGRPRAGASSDLIDRLGLRRLHRRSSRASPTSASSSCTPRPSWPWCPASTRASACPRSRRCATGTALVATDGGALPEVTGRDGDTVLQCAAGDVDALAAAIRRGLDDAELRARVGAAGRQRVRRAVDAGAGAPSSPSSSTARCWRCPRTSPSCAAGTAGDRAMLTIRFDRLADLGLRPGDLVLDAGAGFGRHAFECARRGADVVALDYAADEVAATRGHVRRRWSTPARSTRPTLVGVLRGDATALPFADGSLRRRHHVRGARAHPGRHRRDRRAGSAC